MDISTVSFVLHVHNFFLIHAEGGLAEVGVGGGVGGGHGDVGVRTETAPGVTTDNKTHPNHSTRKTLFLLKSSSSRSQNISSAKTARAAGPGRNRGAGAG